MSNNFHDADDASPAFTAEQTARGGACSPSVLSDDEIDVAYHNHCIRNLDDIPFLGQQSLRLQEPDNPMFSEPEDNEVLLPVEDLSLILGSEAHCSPVEDVLETPCYTPLRLAERLDPYVTVVHRSLLNRRTASINVSAAGNEAEETRQMRKFWYRSKP
jgi:hypothetical protein